MAAELPEVVVAQRNHRAQVTGVGAVVVVQADAGVPGILVFHCRSTSIVPGRWPSRTIGSTWRPGVRLTRQLALDLGEVGYLALLQGRHFLAQLHRRIVLGADHPDATDSGLGDQGDHPPLTCCSGSSTRPTGSPSPGRRPAAHRAPLDVAQAALRPRKGYTAASMARLSSTVLPRTTYSLMSTRRWGSRRGGGPRRPAKRTTMRQPGNRSTSAGETGAHLNSERFTRSPKFHRDLLF